MWKKRELCQKFRHYGLQRSGTNLLEGLMYRYFEVWCRNGGSGPSWKHSLEMQPLQDDMFYLVIAKNPYLWIESIAFRNPMDYIQTQKMYPAQEQTDSKYIVGPNGINVINAAKTWNHFYSNWIDQDRNKVYHIRYEDLLNKNTKTVILNDIQEKFNVERRIKAESYRSKETAIIDRKQDRAKIEYYTTSMPQKLTIEQIQEINNYIDPFLFQQYKYDTYK